MARGPVARFAAHREFSLSRAPAPPAARLLAGLHGNVTDNGRSRYPSERREILPRPSFVRALRPADPGLRPKLNNQAPGRTRWLAQQLAIVLKYILCLKNTSAGSSIVYRTVNPLGSSFFWRQYRLVEVNVYMFSKSFLI